MSRKNNSKANAKRRAKRATIRAREEFRAAPPTYVRTRAERTQADLWTRKMSPQ